MITSLLLFCNCSILEIITLVLIISFGVLTTANATSQFSIQLLSSTSAVLYESSSSLSLLVLIDLSQHGIALKSYPVMVMVIVQLPLPHYVGDSTGRDRGEAHKTRPQGQQLVCIMITIDRELSSIVRYHR